MIELKGRSTIYVVQMYRPWDEKWLDRYEANDFSLADEERKFDESLFVGYKFRIVKRTDEVVA